MLAWVKQANGFSSRGGPFVVKIAPKGDGRWNWEVYADGTLNAMATGIASSLGAAKNACEQLVKRSGRV